jgi:hypothetical protein
MTKKKARPARKVADRPAIVVTIRGSQAWKDWVDELVEHCRSDASKVIDNALVDYAIKFGFTKKPPIR